MTNRNLPKSLLSAAAFTCLTLSSWGGAGQAGATVDSFLSTDFSPVSSGDVMFRFTELFGSDGANDSTHILIDGLVEVEDGSGILSSSYAGIDIATGAEYDVGQVLLTLPSGAQTSGATSPIVGIVPRTTPSTGSSGWSEFSNSATVSTVGGSTGTVDFDSDAGTLSFSLSNGGSTLTGTANYSVSQDGSSVSVDAFALSGGGSTYNFEASDLLVINGETAGVIVSSDSNPGYDSLLFNLSIDSDLVGSDSTSWAGYPVDGNGFIDASAWLGFVNLNLAPWYYNFNLDTFMYIPSEPPAGAGFWAYVIKNGSTANNGTAWGGYADPEGDDWIDGDNWIGFFNVSQAPYLYVFGNVGGRGGINTFIYAQEPSAGFSGLWVYFFAP